MKLGILATYLLSFEAGRSLGRHLFKHPLSAVIAGLLYALNTGISSQWVMGQGCFVSYALAPWVVLWCLRCGKHRQSGLFAGLFAGLTLQMGINYYTVYSFSLCALLTLWVGIRSAGWKALLRFGVLFGLGFGVIGATRLFPILAVMFDFPGNSTFRFPYQARPWPGCFWSLLWALHSPGSP